MESIENRIVKNNSFDFWSEYFDEISRNKRMEHKTMQLILPHLAWRYLTEAKAQSESIK